MKPQTNIHKSDKKGGKFFNGLFFGALLGSGVVYVLTSKKRREIVRGLISQGIDLLEDVKSSDTKTIANVVSPIPDNEEDHVSFDTSNQFNEKTKTKPKRFLNKTAKDKK